MIIIITEDEFQKMQYTEAYEDADLVIVLKSDSEAWVAKNRFGKQRSLMISEIPFLVSSFVRVVGF